MTTTSRSAQLDGLRAIAVSLVVVHHYTAWGHDVGLGNIGVQLFFVLSGFLITRILLRFRDRCARGEMPIGAVLGSFHLSRAARIWPVAFLTLALVLVAGERFERRADIIWHALFTSNVFFFLRGEFTGSFAHFWSLAVEQQFYLAWPLLVLLVPARRLETVILALVALAPFSRLALHAAGHISFPQNNVLPMANLDSLGLGALSALWSRGPVAEVATRWRLLAWGSGAAIVGLLALRFTNPAGTPANLEQSLYAVAFAWLIAAGARGVGIPLGSLLSSAPLVWLGTISYGVYVYHVFAPRLVGAGLRAIAAPLVLHEGPPLFVLSCVLTLAVATISWKFLERPILDWRQGRSTVPRLGANSKRSEYAGV
jgi:peptidoglycan/LPS O-acetylase OafA/YrhL